MLALAAALVHAASPRRAWGTERPRVSIGIAGCDAPLARETQRIAAIELRATLVDGAPDATVTQVTASCRGTAAELMVIDPTTGKSLGRTVALTEAASNGRARLLALAIAELVSASWSELESNPKPRAQAATPLAPDSAREAARAAVVDRSLEFAAAFDAHILSSRDVLFGGGGRLALWVSPLLFVRFEGLTSYGQLDRTGGSVSVLMPSLAATVGTARWVGTSLRPALGAGVRAGYLWMNGVADGATATGARQHGLWMGPEIVLQISLWPRSPVHPIIGVAAGWHLVGVRGTVNDGQDVRAVGAWGGISAAVAVR